MMRELSLEHITVWDASPPDIVSIAAELGCSAVSLFVQGTGPNLVIPPLASDRALLKETRRRMAATGVFMQSAECFALGENTDVSAYRAPLDLAASLGARMATSIVFDSDRLRVLDNFSALDVIAAERGLGLNVEFLAFSPLSNLQDAARLVRDCGQSNVGIVVDALHLYRSGGSPLELDELPSGTVGAAQICDGPHEMPKELQTSYEGFEQRLLPGDGVFPLRELIRSLPAELMLGVEVPQRERRLQGVPPRERAALAVAAIRHILKQSAAD